MRQAILLVLALACAGEAKGMSADISLEAGARAKVSVGSCFDVVPSPGYAPMEVTINNFSGATQQWSFDFTSPAYSGGNTASVACHAEFTVENDATRTFPLMVPTSESWEPNPLRVTVSGYGIDGKTDQTFTSGNRTGLPLTEFVGISNSLGAPMWSKLEPVMKDSYKNDLNGGQFDPTSLPEDWRGLSGVAGLWIGESELAQLSPAQRGALRDWMRMGGALFIAGNQDIPSDFTPTGFGAVKMLTAPLDVNQTAGAIHSLQSPRKTLPVFARKTPGPAFESITPNAPSLVFFMFAFAAIVGPVNIFFIAGDTRRQRLFWTTPLISVSASGMLMGWILLKDGVGGTGVRSAVVYVTPREHSEVVLQDQTSRTGLLLGSSFKTVDPVCMSLKGINGSSAFPRARALKNDGLAYGGDWFSSRFVQTQELDAVIPTRAEITLLNADDAQAGKAAPVILSTFAAPLDELVYHDGQNRSWIGKNVQTGQKQELQLRGPTPALAWENAGGAALYAAPNSFVATSADSSAFVETLRSIRWKDDKVTYFGKVTMP